MKLFIAGKQSVAWVIALALSAKQETVKRCEGYFQTVQGDCVTWTGGHLLELADPEAYDSEYRHWRLESLPIIPAVDAWKIIERERSRDQLVVMKQLLQMSTEVIHAGEPDREGQWMVDEVLQYLENILPVKRLLIHDLNILAVRNSLSSLQDNLSFVHLSESAKARSRADWLYGINMTRALTLLGRHSGYEGVLSVGRVQTSVLSMIVQRDKGIEAFRAQPYFEITAKMIAVDDDAFIYSKWCQPSSNELLQDEGACEIIKQKVTGKNGNVLARKNEIIKESPPLPFDLSSLQINCGELFGYSAKEVMDVCFQLYEKHHLISYPRSDCRYLPERLFNEVSETLNAISSALNNNDALGDKIRKSDCWVKQKCWDDKKVSTHHGIIPTAMTLDAGTLTEQELKIYTLIATNYIDQFYPDSEYVHSEIIFGVEGEEFSVSGKQEVVGAWKVGDTIRCDDVDVKNKRTRPPERFTDASLIEAMDGLGTQATKALIIDALLQRGYVIKGNKTIFSSPVGRDLVHALPQLDKKMRDEFDLAETVDIWEKKLTDIVQGLEIYDGFMQAFEHYLIKLVAVVRHQKIMSLTSADEILGFIKEEKFHCSKCQAILIQRHGKHGIFWGCSRYPECKNTIPDRIDKQGNHHPDFVVQTGTENKRNHKFLLDKKCPDCGKQLTKRKGKRGVFAGCSGYPACKYTEPLLSNQERID